MINLNYINGCAHITGGGITDNLPRVLPINRSFEIDLNTWKLPEIMGWFIMHSGMTQEESLKTFNCGIGIVCIVSEKNLSSFKIELYEFISRSEKVRLISNSSL